MALKQRTSTMDENHIQVIQEYGKQLGNLDFSSALRVVITEWLEMKGWRVVGESELPKPEDALPVPVLLVKKEDGQI